MKKAPFYLDIDIEQRHCAQCGGRMMLRERFTREFDKETGQRMTIIEQVCEKILAESEKFFPNRWIEMDHDVTDIIDVSGTRIVGKHKAERERFTKTLMEMVGLLRS